MRRSIKKKKKKKKNLRLFRRFDDVSDSEVYQQEDELFLLFFKSRLRHMLLKFSLGKKISLVCS